MALVAGPAPCQQNHEHMLTVARVYASQWSGGVVEWWSGGVGEWGSGGVGVQCKWEWTSGHSKNGHVSLDMCHTIPTQFLTR